MKAASPETPPVTNPVSKLVAIPIDELRESPTNPRKVFDAAAMQDLIASIKVSGVQQPLIVRPWPKTHKLSPPSATVKYEVVCGARRLRAAAAAGRKDVPALVQDLSDDYAYRAQILENLQREDLGPMEEADGYAVLAARGLPSTDIAAQVGKPPAYVHQRLKLTALIPKVQAALREGKIALGFALEIAKLSGKGEQEQALGWCTTTLHWERAGTVEELRRKIDSEFRLLLKSAPFSTADANLHPAAGSCVECPKRTGADSLLFGDIQGDDRCTDPPCFKVKVDTIIHVRVEDLKKTQGKAPIVTESYQPSKHAPAGTLGSERYERAEKPHRTCGNSIFAIVVDGNRIGQKMKICIDAKCDVHGSGRSSSGTQSDVNSKRLAAERAKDRVEAEVRLRVARAIVEKLETVVRSGDKGDVHPIFEADVLDVCDYAFERMDGTQEGRLAKLLGWEKEKFFGWKSKGADRLDKLRELGMAKAVTLACLASVASNLTVVHTSGRDKGELGLFRLAKRQLVDVAAIRATVEAEAKTKADRKAGTTKAAEPSPPVAKKGQHAAKPKLSPEARKRIAAAQKKRFVAARKAIGKAAKKGGKK